MQFREVTPVYSDSRKVHVTALCGLIEGFGSLKRVIHTVAPVPKVIQVDRHISGFSIHGWPRPRKNLDN